MNHLDFKEEILSVPIWGFNIPDSSSFNEELLDFVYWLRDTTEGKNRSNFLGWQSHDYIYQEYSNFLKPLIQPLLDISNNIAKDFSERINKKIPNTNNRSVIQETLLLLILLNSVSFILNFVLVYFIYDFTYFFIRSRIKFVIKIKFQFYILCVQILYTLRKLLDVTFPRAIKCFFI